MKEGAGKRGRHTTLSATGYHHNYTNVILTLKMYLKNLNAWQVKITRDKQCKQANSRGIGRSSFHRRCQGSTVVSATKSNSNTTYTWKCGELMLQTNPPAPRKNTKKANKQGKTHLCISFFPAWTSSSLVPSMTRCSFSSPSLGFWLLPMYMPAAPPQDKHETRNIRHFTL